MTRNAAELTQNWHSPNDDESPVITDEVEEGLGVDYEADAGGNLVIW